MRDMLEHLNVYTYMHPIPIFFLKSTICFSSVDFATVAVLDCFFRGCEIISRKCKDNILKHWCMHSKYNIHIGGYKQVKFNVKFCLTMENVHWDMADVVKGNFHHSFP